MAKVAFKDAQFTESFGDVELLEAKGTAFKSEKGNSIQKWSTDIGNLTIISPKQLEPGEITVSWLNKDTGTVWAG